MHMDNEWKMVIVQEESIACICGNIVKYVLFSING